tara:strand:+ start:370 stop:591 length:222 start_codon:yes stop_codon:yes gene_type:complete
VKINNINKNTVSVKSFVLSSINLLEKSKYDISIDITHKTKNILSDNSSFCKNPFDSMYDKKNRKKFKTINLLI